MQQFQINIRRTNTVCSQSCPTAKARHRNSLFFTPRLEASSPDAMLVHPSCCASLPADNSFLFEAIKPGQQSKKGKLKWNETTHPSPAFCRIVVWIWRNQPDFPFWKCKEKFEFLFSFVNVSDDCGDRTMVFLPHIVCMFCLCVSLPEPQHLRTHSVGLQLLSIIRLSFKGSKRGFFWDWCQNTTASNWKLRWSNGSSRTTTCGVKRRLA